MLPESYLYCKMDIRNPRVTALKTDCRVVYLKGRHKILVQAFPCKSFQAKLDVQT